MSLARPVESSTKNEELIRDRREQIIQASIKVFSDKGYHGATVRDVGRKSGLTQGTIYNYVRSKEDILFLVCDRAMSEYLEAVRSAWNSEGDAEMRLLAVLRGLAQAMIEHKSTILLIYHESHNLDKRALRALLSRVKEFLQEVESLLCEVREAKTLSGNNLKTITNIITFLPTVFALRGWAMPEDATEEELVNEVVEFMHRALFGQLDTRKNLPKPGPV